MNLYLLLLLTCYKLAKKYTYMKKINYLLIAFTAIGLLSCSKEEHSIADCFGESLLVNIHHNVSTENPKLVNFSVTYSGDHSFDNKTKWDFGDGTPIKTLSGHETSHTYTTAGKYHVKATASLNGGKCNTDVKETITVE